MWLKVYVLVNNLAVVPNLWTFNFTRYQGLHAASGSHWDFTENFVIPWDSTWTIPLESQWNSQVGLHWNSVGSQWDAWFSVGFPSLSSGEIPLEFPAGTMLRSHVGFPGIPPRIPVIFSRWNPSWFLWNLGWTFTGVPLGVPVKYFYGEFIRVCIFYLSFFYVLLYVDLHVCFAIYDLLPVKLIVMYLLHVKCWFNTMSWSIIGEKNILSYFVYTALLRNAYKYMYTSLVFVGLWTWRHQRRAAYTTKISEPITVMWMKSGP